MNTESEVYAFWYYYDCKQYNIWIQRYNRFRLIKLRKKLALCIK